jgi:hypothetical protein
VGIDPAYLIVLEVEVPVHVLGLEIEIAAHPVVDHEDNTRQRAYQH